MFIALTLLVSVSNAATSELSENEYFFDDVLASEVLQVIAEDYGINIVVSEEFKTKKLNLRIKTDSLEKLLKTLSWILNCDYVVKDDIYFFGGKTIVYDVRETFGIKDISKQFGDKTDTVGDKVVIHGNEREVKNVSEAIDLVKKMNACEVYFYIFQVSFDKGKNFGIGVNPTIKMKDLDFDTFKGGKFDVKDFFEGSKVSFDVKTDFSVRDFKEIYNNTLSCVSGKKSNITLGFSEDREIFDAVPVGGQSSIYKTGYNQFQTGLKIDVEPFFDSKEKIWNVEFKLENSVQKGSNQKDIVSMNSTLITKNEATTCLASINLDKQEKKKSGFLNAFEFFQWFMPSDDSEKKITMYVIVSVKVK
ncbi:MAG: hypothetical protein A2X48_20285 [Lentisphaerae bacterium GWF2_49_21]|nr:MAG: hypothetical protein A2X48_20285 [Lentisphaerae bacterium GWF2_49_21]